MHFKYICLEIVYIYKSEGGFLILVCFCFVSFFFSVFSLLLENAKHLPRRSEHVADITLPLTLK